ncbi:benzoate/H(+) symporter BenE family transporter [soil metagenome]
MTDIPQPAASRDIPDLKGWISLTAASLTAVVVGFASTILLIMEAASAVGATPSQKASWAAALCFGMAISSLILSWRYRMPIITAWSTPGAALIATGAAGVDYRGALGAFVLAGLLVCLTALVTPVARLIEKIPAPIASAMLAGVLLRYVTGVPAAALALPLLVLPLVLGFFVLRLLVPLYAVPVLVAAGLVMAGLSGSFGAGCCTIGITTLEWTTPQFNPAAMLGLGVPLYLVTMASQNLPGFAVLRAAGYKPPVTGALWVTGLASLAAAPFGSHSINLAAITASIVTGPDCHPDPAKRWYMAWPYAIFYILVGFAAVSFVAVLGALPAAIITAIAGLALFAPLMGGVAAMTKDADGLEPALVTFLITASGLTLGGIGSAFWGLVGGLLLFAGRHALAGKMPRGR